MTTNDTARIAVAVARWTEELTAIDDRLATLRAQCPTSAVFDAHPEVAWQRARRASVATLRDSLAAAV